jgi:hypothetical protein
MMAAMKLRLLNLCFAMATVFVPVLALAKEDEETALLEARLEGYTQQVRLEDGGTAMAWMLLGFLGIVALACLFKNAKRTHLD